MYELWWVMSTIIDQAHMHEIVRCELCHMQRSTCNWWVSSCHLASMTSVVESSVSKRFSLVSGLDLLHWHLVSHGSLDLNWLYRQLANICTCHALPFLSNNPSLFRLLIIRSIWSRGIPLFCAMCLISSFVNNELQRAFASWFRTCTQHITQLHNINGWLEL